MPVRAALRCLATCNFRENVLEKCGKGTSNRQITLSFTAQFNKSLYRILSTRVDRYLAEPIREDVRMGPTMVIRGFLTASYAVFLPYTR